MYIHVQYSLDHVRDLLVLNATQLYTTNFNARTLIFIAFADIKRETEKQTDKHWNPNYDKQNASMLCNIVHALFNAIEEILCHSYCTLQPLIARRNTHYTKVYIYIVHVHVHTDTTHYLTKYNNTMLGANTVNHAIICCTLASHMDLLLHITKGSTCTYTTITWHNTCHVLVDLTFLAANSCIFTTEQLARRRTQINKRQAPEKARLPTHS